MSFSNPPGSSDAPNDPGLLGPLLFADSFGARGNGLANDTAAVQNAINTANQMGNNAGAKCRLQFTPGKKYLLNSLLPKSYVDILGHGAIFQRDPAYAQDRSIFFHNPAIGIGTPVTQFGIRGVTMGGIGGETSFQGFLLIGQSSFLTIEDCLIHDLPANSLYFGDCQNIEVLGNRLVNTSVQNAINFVSGANGNAVPCKHVWCDRNRVLNHGAIGIAFVGVSNQTRIDPIADVHFTNNTCETNSTTVGWPMGIEQGGNAGTPPNIGIFDISGNTLVQNSAAPSPAPFALALTNDSVTPSNDPLCIYGVTVRGNRLICTVANGTGAYCLASRVAFEGNYVEAAAHDFWLKGHGTAVISRHGFSGNVGHLGTGDHIHTDVGVDLTQIQSAGSAAPKFLMPQMPVVDPHVAGQLWANAGIVTVSAG